MFSERVFERTRDELVDRLLEAGFDDSFLRRRSIRGFTVRPLDLQHTKQGEIAFGVRVYFPGTSTKPIEKYAHSAANIAKKLAREIGAEPFLHGPKVVDFSYMYSFSLGFDFETMTEQDFLAQHYGVSPETESERIANQYLWE